MKLPIILVLTVSACAVEPEVSAEETNLKTTVDGEHQGPSLTSFYRRVTVTGNVYYNNLRFLGRFDLRDPEPFQFDFSPNEPGHPPGSEPFNTGDNYNYYGLRDAQVDIYEADVNYGTGAGCYATQLAGTTTIDRDGSFAWTGDVWETCGADLDGGQDEDVSIAVEISLRNCDNPNTRCFSVSSPTGGTDRNTHFDDNWDGSTWSKWFAGATPALPRRVVGATAPLGSDYFQSTTADADPEAWDLLVAADQAMQAANVFAGMVDVTRKVHVLAGVPFGKPEVKAYFPGAIPATHSHESGRLCVAAGDWADGWSEPHEYGHLVHFWAWEGHGKWTSYCLDNPGCHESLETEEYANTAFKEGWASFIASVTLNKTGSHGCDDFELRRTRACPDGVCTTSRHYIDDVTDALCDVWDDEEECRVRGDGVYCDYNSLSLLEMWNGLADVWDHASDGNRTIVENADEAHPAILTTFGVCTLMGELDDDAVNLGATLAVSGLDCGL